MIELVALGVVAGIVCGLGLLMHAVRPERAPVAALDRLREQFAHSDMEVDEFERRVDAILSTPAAHGNVGGITDGPSDTVKLRGDFHAGRVRATSEASEWDARLVELERQYPDLRDTDIAERVVDLSRRIATRERHPERWQEPQMIERAYLEWAARWRPPADDVEALPLTREQEREVREQMEGW